MPITKVQKTVILPVDKLQKIDQIAQKQDIKFTTAMDTILEYGLREYERRMGAPAPVVG
jgi:hypothetical protein